MSNSTCPKLTRRYAGRGSAAHHPATLLGLLIYGYATGTFSSRKIERAIYESLAFRFIAANTHPDHDTIATFRRRFLPQIEALFVQVLQLAREMKLLKLGTGSKVKANASKHKALSYAHAQKLEAQLQDEVSALMRLAEAADHVPGADGMDVPAEIARRQARLAALAEAKARIEARAKERFAAEQQEYEAKQAKWQAQRDAGKKPRGKGPKPPKSGPGGQDQVNLTDEESRIMPKSGGGFEPSYNVQAGVDAETMLVVCAHVTQATNDKRQLVPALEKLQALPSDLGQPTHLLADSGYFSGANVEACEQHGIEPLLAMKRETHHLPVFERFAPDVPVVETADAVQRMAQRLKTKAGRALYALRKQCVEPVFGIIKQAMGFRQFSLRGLEKVSGEWSLVTLAWNIKRLNVLRGA